MVLAVMARYFPSPNPVGPSGYCSDSKIFSQVTRDETLIPSALFTALEQTGKIPTPGDVKYIFLTKPGPGPIKQPIEESLLDPATGNVKQPSSKHKRLQITASTSTKNKGSSYILGYTDGLLIGTLTVMIATVASYYLSRSRRF